MEQNLNNFHEPMLGSIFQVILKTTLNDPDENVALRACMFWQMFCEGGDGVGANERMNKLVHV